MEYQSVIGFEPKCPHENGRFGEYWGPRVMPIDFGICVCIIHCKSAS